MLFIHSNTVVSTSKHTLLLKKKNVSKMKDKTLNINEKILVIETGDLCCKSPAKNYNFSFYLNIYIHNQSRTLLHVAIKLYACDSEAAKL